LEAQGDEWMGRWDGGKVEQKHGVKSGWTEVCLDGQDGEKDAR